MSAYVRLVESLLVEMSNRDRSRRGRGPSKNELKRQRKAAAATATATAATSKDVEARNTSTVDTTPSPVKPIPSPVDPSPQAQAAIDAVKKDQGAETKPEPDKEDKTPEKPSSTPVDRSRVGGAKADTDELGRTRKPEAPVSAATPGKPEAQPEKEEKPKLNPEQQRKADALNATQPGRGRQLGRVVRGAGDRYSLARSLSRRYARSVDPGSRDKIDKVRNFRRGVDAIGKGTMAGVKKFLKTGKNLPSGGQSLV